MKSYLLQKICASIVNGLLILIITLPLGLWFHFDLRWKLSFLTALLAYELLLLSTKSRRDLGMVVAKTVWVTGYNTTQYILFNILYCLSFATLFFHYKFPFDLFIINMLLLQLPSLLMTGKTFHGFVSGMKTIAQ